MRRLLCPVGTSALLLIAACGGSANSSSSGGGGSTSTGGSNTGGTSTGGATGGGNTGGGNTGGSTGGNNTGGTPGGGGTGGQTTTLVPTDLPLDSSYGESGIAFGRLQRSIDMPLDGAFLPDGSLLWAGSTAFTGREYEGLLTKFTPTGQLDTSYGDGGHALLVLENGTRILGIEPLADGHVLVFGSVLEVYTSDYFLARVDANGALDTTFGAGGWVHFNNLFDFLPYGSFARTSTGDIVALVAASGSSESTIYRFHSDGTLDMTFGQQGKVTVSGGAARRLRLRPDDSLLALTATSAAGSLHHVGVNGLPDAAFGNSGSYDMAFAPFDMTVSSGGDIAITGGTLDPQVVRLDVTGKPVAAFGGNNDGIAHLSGAGSPSFVKWLQNGDLLALRAILGPSGAYQDYKGATRLDATGKPVAFDTATLDGGLFQSYVGPLLQKNGDLFVVAGHSPDPSMSLSEAMIVSVHESGAASAGFGSSGVVIAGSNAEPELLNQLAVRPDGSVLGAGLAGFFSAIERFNTGTLDSGFGTSGGALSYQGGANGIAVDAMSRVYLTHSTHSVERYLANGTLDTTFGPQGLFTIPTNDNSDALGVAVDAMGRVVVSGNPVVGAPPFVARFTANGTLDGTFGGGGVAKPLPQSEGAEAFFALGPDGKIALSGRYSVDFSYVARLDDNGSLDPTFGSGGRLDFPVAPATARVVARKSGGYLVAGLTLGSFQNSTIDVVATTANGALDPTFGSGGVVQITGVSYFDGWIALAELPDGGAMVGGAVRKGDFDHLALWRLHADGTPDTAFFEDGLFTLPMKSHATSAILDGQGGLLIGGWATTQKTGTDMITLRFVL
ncbi:MAG: hypothetical protein U0441_35925 [Polyangiaceae bacterium]